jgi:peptidoglycan glycosyltransferase
MLNYYAKKMTNFDVVNGLYRYGNEGGRITLTLSASVQKAALEAMGSYKGTLAVYNYKTGEILCAVSTPTYDPDNVPDIVGDPVTYEGAYLNRFLQSTYTPGSIFKIVTLTAALENLEDPDSWSYTCAGRKEYGIDRVTCLRQHGTQNLQQAFCNSCNCAFAALADELGGQVLQQYADALGITKKVGFDGINTVPGRLSVTGEADVMVAWSAIGQHKDLVNPCQFLTMVGAIASGGSGAKPYIVEKIDGGEWGSYTAQVEKSNTILSPETAKKLQAMMRYNVKNYYGDANFPGLTVCAKSGTAEVGSKNNSLFVGFVEDEEYPLAFIAVVEDGSYGRVTCIPILSKVLAACKEVLDGE